jgi:hypothetical protein
MGYTHYWNKIKELPQNKWGQFESKVAELIFEGGSEGVISGESGDDEIRFNGVGKEAYETFLFTRVESDEGFVQKDKDGKYFNFCKTARRPYDKFVVAVLLLAKEYFGDQISLSSDGVDEELREGIELAEKICNRRN